MFDMKAEIGIPIPSPEAKKAIARFPSDQEFAGWRRKKKVSQKDLGRDKFQLESSRPGPEDTALLNAIRIDKDGPELDEAEAYYIISRLASCEAIGTPEREGSAYVIKMRVMGKLKTAHTLRIPSVKEMMDYERMRSSVTFSKGFQEIRINFQAAADLYDRVKVSTEGYANDIPVPHKAEAINVLLQAVRNEHEESDVDDEDEDQD